MHRAKEHIVNTERHRASIPPTIVDSSPRSRVPLYVAIPVFLVVIAVASPACAVFTQCPPIGYADGCSFLITFQPGRKITISFDPSIRAFDNIEDTLVGVQNNTDSTVFGLFLTGPGIFGFDGDGAGDPAGSFWAAGSPHGAFPGGPFGPTGYEGPNIAFAVEDDDSGVVNFFHVEFDSATGHNKKVPGLLPGQSLWFSLEGSPSSVKFRQFVAVDPGHGRLCAETGQPWGGTSDASGRDHEDEFALDIANALTAILDANGYRVFQTRTTECDLEPGDGIASLHTRTRLVNEEGVDIFVSIHLNGNEKHTAHGTEVLVSGDAGHPDSAETALAQLILQNQVGLHGLERFGTGVELRTGPTQIHVLSFASMPAVLSEVAFLSNSERASTQIVTDEELLDDPSIRLEMGLAIFRAIDKFFNP